jgi:hypothetical protein
VDYTNIKEYLPASNFIYQAITPEEVQLAEGSIYLTEINGIRYLGTNSVIEELADKLLVAPQDAVIEEEEVVQP